MENLQIGRRGALAALGQLCLGVAAAACVPTNNTAGPTPTTQPAASTSGGAPAAAATLGSAQAAASPAAQPAASPAPGASPAASPSPVAIPNPQASPVSGAAPLPQQAPTPGGPPPTLVGVAGAPSPQPNAAGAFVNEGTSASPVASPAASPAAIASPSAQPAATVRMTADRKFDPAQVTVPRGQSVTWRNESRSPQTVTFDPAFASDPSHVVLPSGVQPFDSGVINPNGNFSHAFDTPGDYQYVSLPFESQNMIGRVTVQG